MALNVIADVGRALEALERERRELDRQIALLHQVLRTLQRTMPSEEGGVMGSEIAPRVKRRHMSASARQTVRRRMKAYWAKRKAQAAKSQAKSKTR